VNVPEENSEHRIEDQVEASEPEEAEEKKIEIEYPESFIYANVASVSFSQLDCRIVYAEVLPDGRTFTKAGIVMPPEHAAALALVLINHVQAYEKRFGQIRLQHWQDMKRKYAPKPSEPKLPEPPS
jgi:hypothetical protein